MVAARLCRAERRNRRFSRSARQSLALPKRRASIDALRVAFLPFALVFLPREAFAFAFRRAHRSAKNARRQIAHGGALELSRGPPRAFFPAVSTVAEQSRHRFPPAKEVHLKSVRLFLGARLGVDATNVLFRIGISSFFHGSCAERTTLNRPGATANTQYAFNDSSSPIPAAGRSPALPLRPRTPPPAGARNTDSAAPGAR